MREGLVAAAVLLLAGCSCFRATAGPGLGLGVAVHAGPLDVDAIGGIALQWGNSYGVIGEQGSGEIGFPLLGRVELLHGTQEGVDRLRVEGPLGLVFKLAEVEQSDEICLLARPRWPSRCTSGSSPSTSASTRDRRDRIEPEALDGLLEDERPLLVRTHEKNDFRVASAPSLALVASFARSEGVRRALGAVEAKRAEKLYADALRLHDADGLEAALDQAPLAPQALEAARSRSRSAASRHISTSSILRLTSRSEAPASAHEASRHRPRAPTSSSEASKSSFVASTSSSRRSTFPFEASASNSQASTSAAEAQAREFLEKHGK